VFFKKRTYLIIAVFSGYTGLTHLIMEEIAMQMKSSAPESIDEYIRGFPEDVRVKLLAIRSVIKSVVPEAQEKISYQMPCFLYNGPLVYFAAFRNHIGFYPTPNGIDEFKEELSRYRQGKGSVQFPINEEMPLDLIARITAYRADENRQKQMKNQKEKK